MKVRSILFACGVFVCALAGYRSASASEVLYDRTGFVSGQQSFVLPMDLSGPGTLTITLSNVAWPEQLANLNLLLGTASGMMGTEMGAGTETFHIATGGRVFAQWFATAQGPLSLGLYSLDVRFQPSAATVPLPASLGLLASALAVLIWRRRPRAPASGETAS
jgi:hypothetical protein